MSNVTADDIRKFALAIAQRRLPGKELDEQIKNAKKLHAWMIGGGLYDGDRRFQAMNEVCKPEVTFGSVEDAIEQAEKMYLYLYSRLS